MIRENYMKFWLLSPYGGVAAKLSGCGTDDHTGIWWSSGFLVKHLF